jgi:hypothetical protein
MTLMLRFLADTVELISPDNPTGFLVANPSILAGKNGVIQSCTRGYGWWQQDHRGALDTHLPIGTVLDLPDLEYTREETGFEDIVRLSKSTTNTNE